MAVMGYTYQQIDDWLLAVQHYWEEQAELSVVALGIVDNDPFGVRRHALQQRWEKQEAWIDVIGMIRREFREFDRKRNVDASHDEKETSHE